MNGNNPGGGDGDGMMPMPALGDHAAHAAVMPSWNGGNAIGSMGDFLAAYRESTRAARAGDEVDTARNQQMFDAMISNEGLGPRCGLPTVRGVEALMTFNTTAVLDADASFQPGRGLVVIFGDGSRLDCKGPSSLFEVVEHALAIYVEDLGVPLEEAERRINFRPLFEWSLGGREALALGAAKGYPPGYPVREWLTGGGALMVNVWHPEDGYRSTSHVEAVSYIPSMTLYDIRCDVMRASLDLAVELGFGERSGWRAVLEGRGRSHRLFPPDVFGRAVAGRAYMTSLTEALVEAGAVFSADHILESMHGLKSTIEEQQVADSVTVALSAEGTIQYEAVSYVTSDAGVDALSDQIMTKLGSAEATGYMSAVVINAAKTTTRGGIKAAFPSRGTLFRSHTPGSVTSRRVTTDDHGAVQRRLHPGVWARPGVEVSVKGEFLFSVSLSSLSAWERKEVLRFLEILISGVLRKANLLSVVEVNNGALYQSIRAHAGQNTAFVQERGFVSSCIDGTSGMSLATMKTVTSYLKSVPAMSALALKYVGGQNAENKVADLVGSFKEQVMKFLSKDDYLAFCDECFKSGGGMDWEREELVGGYGFGESLSEEVE